MRRFSWMFVLVLVCVLAPSLEATSLKETRPTARAWLVLDDVTGIALRFNRSKEFRPIASTTKLLTALVVTEVGKLETWVTISANAAGQQPSKMGLRKGERWRRRDLLHALLMQSANDAATALAESVSGSESKFCQKLTVRSRALGCSGTKIRRASGLPSTGQGSTARDLARISQATFKKESLRKILKTSEVTIRSSGGRSVRIVNKNRLHAESHPVLGKTGYTRRAQRCFAGQMVLGGRSHTVVLLGSKNLWGDLRLMRSWTQAFAEALKQNRTSLTKEQVIVWQKRLKQAGQDPGAADGVWGAKTQMAYFRWEQARSPKPNGKVSQ